MHESNVGRVRDAVMDRLAEDERCRNSDRYLYVDILAEFYEIDAGRMTLAQWVTADCPDYESVRRARNSIQAEGLYPPTDPEVAKKRGRSMVTGEHDGSGLAGKVRADLGYAVSSEPPSASLFGNTALSPGQEH